MEFNTAAAQAVYRIISKMDPGEAELFGVILVNDMFDWDKAANARLIERVDREQRLQQTEMVAKSCLGLLEKGKDEEAVAVAASVAVSKEESHSWMFQERPRDGQFGHMTRQRYKAEKKRLKANKKLDEAQKRFHQERLKQQLWGSANGYNTVNRGGLATVDTAREFAPEWNKPPDPNSGASDSFHRLRTGGRLAQGIGHITGNDALAIGGAVANYAGQFGPEAEKVIGPSLRRTAYRYRGTERRPDHEITVLGNDEAKDIVQAEGISPGARRITLADGRIALAPEQPLKSIDPQQRVYAMEQAGVNYFLGNRKDGRPARVPSAKYAELQRSAGRVTPSEGILIDEDGKVVHQAVGFAEDHYLPFNLKHLGALKGGSYVRTRESGGPTSEDIYTGLMSGARALTVVSNSGVFTLEFDDQLRGGRRYNDKAKQMVKRYQHLLDAIQSEQVRNPARKIPDAYKAQIRQKVEESIKNNPELEYYSEDEKNQWVKDEMARELSKPHLTENQVEQLKVRANVGAKDEKEADYIFRQLRDEALEQQQTDNYKLDGEGYAAALDALREQFPYYIQNVKYQTKERNTGYEIGRFNANPDQAYVKARHIRPAGALSGFYDTSIAGEGKGVPQYRQGKEMPSGKRRADTIYYQNRKILRSEEAQRPTPTTTEGGEGGESTSTATGESRPRTGSLQAVLRQSQERREGKSDKQDYADNYLGKDLKYHERLHSDKDVPYQISQRYGAVQEWLHADPERRLTIQRDERKQPKLSTELDELEEHNKLENTSWPQDRKWYASRRSANRLNPEALGDPEPPDTPLKVDEAQVKHYLEGPRRQEFSGLLKFGDDELKKRSKKQRELAKGYADAGRKEPENKARANVQMIETARYHLSVNARTRQARTSVVTLHQDDEGSEPQVKMTYRTLTEQFKKMWKDKEYGGSKKEFLDSFEKHANVHNLDPQTLGKWKENLEEWFDRNDEG